MNSLLFIISAPSGTGKTTLVHHLLARMADIVSSISTTTRAPRPGEANGRDYHFTDEASFQAQIEAGEFLEWAKVHGNYYGTSRRFIEEAGAQGRDTILEIDWQGAEQIRKAMPDQVVSIFILPPSTEVLVKRLTGRGTDSVEVILRRLMTAQEEMCHIHEFDYVIINTVLEAALEELISIIRVARLSYAQQKQRHSELLAALCTATPSLTT